MISHKEDIDAARAWVLAGCPAQMEYEPFGYKKGVMCDWTCFVDMIPSCGCGDPISAIRFLRETLEEVNRDPDERRRPYGSPHEQWPDYDEQNGAYWMLWYLIDELGWIEHGTNVRGSWLTDEGKLAIGVLYGYESHLEREEHEQSSA